MVTNSRSSISLKDNAVPRRFVILLVYPISPLKGNYRQIGDSSVVDDDHPDL